MARLHGSANWDTASGQSRELRMQDDDAIGSSRSSGRNPSRCRVHVWMFLADILGVNARRTAADVSSSLTVITTRWSGLARRRDQASV